MKNVHYVIMGSLRLGEDAPSMKDIIMPATTLEEVQYHLHALVQRLLREIAELCTVTITDTHSPEYELWQNRPEEEKRQDIEIARDPDGYYRKFFVPAITNLAFFDEPQPNKTACCEYIASQYVQSIAWLFEGSGSQTVLHGKINYYIIRYSSN